MQNKEPTLSVCMIVKDCAEELRTTLDSLPKWIHELVVVDTGSKDESTKDVAREFNARVFDYVDPDPIVWEDKVWLSDFAAARNEAFSHCTGDYIMWIDSDDVLWEAQPGMLRRAFLECVINGKADVIGMTYDYEHDSEGNCTMRHGRERIVKNDGWHWRSPIHEVLCPTWTQFHRYAIDENECRVVHVSIKGDGGDKLRSMRNYLVAKRHMDAQGGEGEARLHMHIGNSLVGLHRYEEAIPNFREHLKGSLWKEEKHDVRLSIANCYKNMGDLDRAKEELLMAIGVDPEMKEGYIELASICLMRDEPDQALIWAQTAEEKSKDNAVYKHNPLHLSTRATEVRAIAQFKLGEYRECLKACNEILEKGVSNKEVLGYKALVSKILRDQELADAYGVVEKAIAREKRGDKVKSLMDAAPEAIRRHPEYGVPAEIHRPVGKKTLCIYCGEGFKNWDYTSVKEGGIGGSETAVVHISRELADLGWHVEVYGFPHETNDGENEGVHWHPFWRVPSDYHYDVLINWRGIGSVVPLPSATVKVAWFHDVQHKDRWERTAAEDYDKFIVLSEAHRNNIDWVPDEKVFVSRNGLDPSFFEGLKDVEKIPKRMVYASCPSRGLEHIMDNWDKIREAHPDATIDVYYGFTELYREMMANDERLRGIYNSFQEFRRKPGVDFHGMVDQRELGRAFARASIWAYPCHFPEISCITAMQAQVTGAVPVTTRFWALEETVREGVKVGLTDEPINEVDGGVDEWVENLIAVLHGVELAPEFVDESRKYFLWSEVAKEWTQEFTSLLKANQSSSSLAEPTPV